MGAGAGSVCPRSAWDLRAPVPRVIGAYGNGTEVTGEPVTFWFGSERRVALLNACQRRARAEETGPRRLDLRGWQLTWWVRQLLLRRAEPGGFPRAGWDSHTKGARKGLAEG